MTALQGFGLGLRPQHYDALLNGTPNVDWLEILSENYLVDGGRPLHMLDRIAERWPLAMHGVSMNIGGSDPLDRDYLAQLGQLARRVRPHLISDHLCWTRHDGIQLHDLLPLPQDDAVVRHVAARVRQVQDTLNTQLVLENVSSYLQFSGDTLDEAHFLSAIVDASGCGLLLDVNNVYVNAHNHGFDARAFLDALPVHAVRQIHLAGHAPDALGSGLLIDTHDAPVCDGVWSLYAHAVRRFGDVPTMIERDDHIPPLRDLLDELDIARAVAAGAGRMSAVLARRQAALHDWLRGGDAAIRMHVATPPQVPADAATRLRIYADGYRLRLIAVLSQDFPVLAQWLGTEHFTALAGDYLRDHPSTRPSVRHLGHAFADWLATQCDVDTGAVELAQFEWTQGEVFDAPDARAATLAEVAVLPVEAWPTLQLSFQPALRCLPLQTCVPALVIAHAAEHPLPESPDADPADWLLWRQDFDVHWRRLPADEASALRHMADGGTFGDLCAQLEAEHGTEAPLRAVGLLKRWIHDGLVTALQAAPQVHFEH